MHLFQVSGVKMVSQLALINGFDIIREMPIDYMHGVLLGIVKMFFSFWFDNKYKKKSSLKNGNFKILSLSNTNMCKLRKHHRTINFLLTVVKDFVLLI